MHALFTGKGFLVWGGVLVFPCISTAETLLFVDVPAQAAGLTQIEATVVRIRAVSVNTDRLRALRPTDQLPLVLFADVSVTLEIERTEQVSAGSRALFGRLIGDPTSSATLIIRGGILVGDIRRSTTGEHYQIRYAGNGVHTIREIDDNKYLPCGVGQAQRVGPPARGAIAPPLAQGCIEDGSVIEVLVVYTRAARDGAGGTAAIEALIDLAVADTNQAYANSLIDTRLRLAHRAEVDYDESGAQLAVLRDPADGVMDEVHVLRDQYHADLVALVVNSAGYCGIASVMQELSADFQAYAFSVTVRDCLGALTFAHELGHNQGCAHDRNNVPPAGLYPYSYGYQEPGAAFRTILAYGCPNGNCPRIPRFSNPDVLFDGLPTGVPTDQPDAAHNALTINQSAQTVACFRIPDCNGNGIPDYQDIANGTSEDCSGNGIPDECEPDCNGNSAADSCDILFGVSEDCDSSSVPDECEPVDCNGNGVHDACDVRDGLSPDCNDNGVPDECDVVNGSSNDCDGDGVPDECEVDCNDNGLSDDCDIAEGLAPDVDGDGVPDMCEAPVLYVDASAIGSPYGTSWDDAFLDLQDALTIAAKAGNGTGEIWVAEGVYRPSRRSEPDDARTVTFQLLSGVALYGGFAGGENDRGLRQPAAHLTVLSGDLLANDDGDLGREENAYHVVTGSVTNTSPILDGFVVTGGQADGQFGLHAEGGGLRIENGSPTIAGCTFYDNRATKGGGAYLYGVNLTSFLNCRFEGNQATQSGGGAYVIFLAVPTFTNCVFSGNSSSLKGAGLSSQLQGRPVLVNCVVSQNVNLSSNPGAGIHADNGSELVIQNSILWGNQANFPTTESLQVRLLTDSTADISYSCVQGWTGSLGGVGNIGADPLLIDPLGWDGVAGTSDDDFRLSAGSPSIDAGSNGPVVTAYDLDEAPRMIDVLAAPDVGTGVPPIVDMGPYEHRADCNSNGIHDQNDIAGGTSSDCNGNGIPDACERWQPFRGFALVPVSATGSYELSPECNEIVVGVGERVTLEVHVGAWDPDLDGQPRLGLYSARIDTSSFTSGQRGSLDPLRIPCEDDAQCRGQCAVGGFCDHQSSIFVDTSDPDWPYFGKSSGYGASSSGFVVSAFAADAADAAVDDGAPRYGGTLVLDVSTDAAGTFTLRFDSSAVDTKLRNENNTADIELVDLLPARIVVLADCNANGIPDDEDIAGGTSGDCNQNGVPDECETVGACDSPDTDGDGVCDDCDQCPGFDDAVDSDLDGVPDGCDLCPGVDDANCSIPATSVWGLILFGILVMTAGSLILRKSGSRSPRLRVPEAIAAVSCD